MPITVELSAGDLIDRITILELKRGRLEPSARAAIAEELKRACETRDRELQRSTLLSTLTEQLRDVNRELWDVEEALRICEAKQQFGCGFIDLARIVYTANDRRAALKRSINEAVGSRLQEHKSYPLPSVNLNQTWVATANCAPDQASKPGAHFVTFVVSCQEREATLARSLESLRRCGWDDAPEVVLDDGVGERAIDRIHRTWRRAIRRAAAAETDFVLLLEDDVVFGKWFSHNLKSWAALRDLPPSRALYASLYNPGQPFLARRTTERCVIADARFVWGAQALVMTPQTARFIDTHWNDAEGNPDMRMPRIAARVTAIQYHVPSLVDHAPVPTTWGGIEHRAHDFDPEWRAIAD